MTLDPETLAAIDLNIQRLSAALHKLHDLRTGREELHPGWERHLYQCLWELYLES